MGSFRSSGGFCAGSRRLEASLPFLPTRMSSARRSPRWRAGPGRPTCCAQQGAGCVRAPAGCMPLPPRLRAWPVAAVAVEDQRDRNRAMVTVSHSSSMVCCKPRRGNSLRASGARCPGAARVKSGRRAPAARAPDLLAHRHLLARCKPGERGQQRGQLGVRTGQSVLNGVQGLLLPCAEAHDGPFRVSLAARGYALAIARVKEVVLPPLHGGAAVAGNAVIRYRLRPSASATAARAAVR